MNSINVTWLLVVIKKSYLPFIATLIVTASARLHSLLHLFFFDVNEIGTKKEKLMEKIISWNEPTSKDNSCFIFGSGVEG